MAFLIISWKFKHLSFTCAENFLSPTSNWIFTPFFHGIKYILLGLQTEVRYSCHSFVWPISVPLPAVCQVAGHQGGNSGSHRGTRTGEAGTRADSEWTHSRTQTQVWKVICVEAAYWTSCLLCLVLTCRKIWSACGTCLGFLKTQERSEKA